MNIRQAQPSDIQKIAEVHVESWKSTYRGIISQAYLDDLTVDEQIEKWEERSLYGTFVAEDEEGVFGFASFGKQRDQQFAHYDAELYAIYLIEGKQKTGAGTALIATGIDYLIEEGFSHMLLWVFDRNSAVQFYQKLQPNVVATSQFELAGDKHDETCFGWELLMLQKQLTER
ncbi:N-acetyltransferase family protein [Bacillus sp. NPDC077027]|uniref:GNAT family N-acetyltransferase n=1 Tax=Bacillus sp. NPDC077027 TaxID=3390548 RepID=UPI003CFF0879